MVDNHHFPSDVVQAIQDSVSPMELTLGDLSYVSRPIYLPPEAPRLCPLDINTLTGVVQYRKSLPDVNLLIHVASPTQVYIITPTQGRHKQRDIHVDADCSDIIGKGFRFGEFMDVEQFIINLQSQFLADENRATILACVGNLASEHVRTLEDDGVSQAVETKTRLAQRSLTRVPNPITLRPYRTFPEVEQPASDFVLRLRQGDAGELPKAALFASDGGRWKLAAMTAIAEWIDTQLSNTSMADTRVIA